MKKQVYLFKEERYYKGYIRQHGLRDYESRELDRCYEVKALDKNTVLIKIHVYKLIGIWEYRKTIRKLNLLF